MAPAEVVDPLIYDGLVEELIEVLEVKNPLLQVRERQGQEHTYTNVHVHVFSHSMRSKQLY